jgi:hypothetical protein
MSRLVKPRYATEKYPQSGRWIWSNKEIAYLKRWCGKVPITEIARRLGRTIGTTCTRACMLGVARRFKDPYADILGKTFGYITPYKIQYDDRGNALAVCRDTGSLDGSDRVVKAHWLRYALRNGTHAGQNRPRNKDRVHEDGYVMRNVGGHSKMVHRIIMEEYLGRPLLSSETVHHKGARTDNRIEMLVLKNKAHGRGQSIYDQIVWLRSLGVSINFIPAKLKKIWKD